MPPSLQVVTLNSKPVPPALPPPSAQKAPRVIKLTPAQFAAIKRGRAGQIVLPALSSQGRRETITLKNPSLSSPSTEHGGLARLQGPAIAVSSPVVPRKMIR